MKETLDGERLRECPFCGSKRQMILKKQIGVPYYAVKCDCGAQTGLYRCPESLAVEKWNTRTPSPSVELPEGHAVVDVSDTDTFEVILKKHGIYTADLELHILRRMDYLRRAIIDAHTLTNKNTEEGS